MTVETASWASPDEIFADFWTYDKLKQWVKDSIDYYYQIMPDCHIVLYAKRLVYTQEQADECYIDGFENGNLQLVGKTYWEIYYLRC